MKLTLGRTKSKIRVLYKSGNSHSQWFIKFVTVQDLSEVKWQQADHNIRPLVMGIGEVEAVWQEDYRINLFAFLWANTFGYLLK
jgi:hypothetical protein